MALAAGLLVGAACGASDRVELRAVAPSTTTSATVALRPDAIRYIPRPVPATRASRGGERSSGSAGKARDPRSSAPAASVGTGGSLTVSSTAYCETGGMANGQRTYDGAVAMNGQPIGSRWNVLSGPYAGRVLTVADRIGHGSQFDIAMPGRCQAALNYGRKQISVERVG